jgi:DNA-binding CsgD family transcriptional regulator
MAFSTRTALGSACLKGENRPGAGHEEDFVLDLLIRGLSHPEICGQLVISGATAKTSVAKILQKLGLRPRPGSHLRKRKRPGLAGLGKLKHERRRHPMLARPLG